MGFVRQELRDHPQSAKTLWTEAIFGRDYSAIVNADVPTWALVGTEPLGEPRAFDAFPSLLSPADVELLDAAGVRVRRTPGGHAVHLNAPDLLTETLTEAQATARG